ncbi:type II toxin-antitoxin system RelE family toxin [Ectothiorhodospira haloalkaliphila]|uniref:type II toxin-antitoxin system RelE family toxin n=1 Tax=Ectothiorhodospira haloalkaliphila TaxID=421628 RepID=UPI0004BCF435|nr:type II toxin-antitoxin system RelE/ParE family toxin [Ectothiorhodospira haloalkaliphila]
MNWHRVAERKPVCKLSSMLEVIYKKAAGKGLAKMPKPQRTKMEAEIRAVAATPADYLGDWKPLVGSPYWRLRVGQYRAICQVNDRELVLLVIDIGPRGGIYK